MADITLTNVRVSHVHVHQPQERPGQEPKFSVTILMPKTDVAGKATLDRAVEEAAVYGVSAKWNGQRPPMLNVCVHDGDGPRPSDGAPYGEECRGMWVVTASCKANRPPFVVDRQINPILDPREVYSGMWANVSVNFYPYASNGKKGIGCGLNGLQKVRDDEPLTSHVTAQTAFQVLGAAPAAPAYGQQAPAQAAPVYGQQPAAPAQAAPTYGQPAAPAAPAYGQPAAPAAPAYGQPAVPTAPAYGQPAVPTAPAYGQPAVPTAPAYGQPATPAAPAAQPQYDPITGQIIG